MRRIFLRLMMVLAVAAIAGGAALGFVYVRLTAPGPLAHDRTLVIARGTGTESIARDLGRAGVIEDPTLFNWAARVAGRRAPMKAGEYRFAARMNAVAVIQLLQSGKTVVRRLTIAEGLTTRQIIEQLMATEGLEGPVAPVPAEGSLLPETYHFSYGDTREAMVQRMQKAMRETVSSLWTGRTVGPVLKTPEAAVVLASIVEKETGIPTERSHIAAVFVNRLQAGMRLQSDPTVVYAVGGGLPLGRALTQEDLRASSPFNTYLNAGLPPGPIANPGRAALAAAMRPAGSDDLYFVADGAGGHVFARTLEEHNRNVRRWRQLRREQESTPPK